MKGLIPGYPVGSDITLLECYYQYPRKNPETDKYEKDNLIIVFKDNKTGEKKHHIIECPEYTFYRTKDNAILDHNELFIGKEDVEPITCKYTELEKTIAESCPQNLIEHVNLDVLNKYQTNLDWFYDNIKSGNRSENRKLHTIHEVFRSDLSIEDYYRFQFGQMYTNNIPKLNKAYFDIEVDTRWMQGSFVEMGECAVNAIAFMDERSKTIISFLLRDDRNSQIAEFESDVRSGRIGKKEVQDFIREAIGGKKQYIRFKMGLYEIQFRFYDEEIELIADFFRTVHQYSPDFIEGWNSSGFDLNYLGARVENLGYTVPSIFCDQSWELKIVKHFIDQRNISLFAERGDYTFISGHTIWIDQMIQFASRRKSKIGSFTSFKLDDIGVKTAKVHKLDYSDITTDIGMLPWLAFKRFVFYNIFDVVVQYCIETKTQDLEYIYTKCLVNNTSYKKGHRQTVYLINRMTKEFDAMGYIIGNNINKWNEEPDKFAGALVGNPLNTNDYAKMKINGVPIMVCETLQDYDYKSLYPSIDLENNIAPNTQVGRIVIDKQIYDNENVYNNPKYQRGGEFIENMVTDNIIEFCHRWFHFAGFMELLEDIKEFYQNLYLGVGEYRDTYYYDSSNNKYMITPIRLTSLELIEPIKFVKDIKPIYFVNQRKETNNVPR